MLAKRQGLLANALVLNTDYLPTFTDLAGRRRATLIGAPCVLCPRGTPRPGGVPCCSKATAPRREVLPLLFPASARAAARSTWNTRVARESCTPWGATPTSATTGILLPGPRKSGLAPARAENLCCG